MSKKNNGNYNPFKLIEFNSAKAKLEKATGINFTVSGRTHSYQTTKGSLTMTDHIIAYNDTTMGGNLWILASEDGTKFRLGDVDSLSHLIRTRL